MSVEKAYNSWAKTYDDVENKTRDLEELAARTKLQDQYNHILELGCGTGKNTSWLSKQAQELTALDFSEEMLTKAKLKVNRTNVNFIKTDLQKDWPVASNKIDLITCSLVLEHFKDLDLIFQQAYDRLISNGEFFLCELHPFKQYSGSKARFENGNNIEVLETYTHHISDYLDAAKNVGFKLKDLDEWFDENDRNEIPRLISFVFKK